MDFFKKERSFLFRFILIMKIFLSLTIVFMLQATASVYSQNARITLDFENAGLGNVLSKIESETDFVFFYRHGTIDNNIKVNIHAKNQDIYKVLDEMFKDTGIDYSVRDRLIILGQKESKANQALQGIAISGIVKDNMGEPMPGVNVILKGTTTGVVTNVDGKYNLNVPGKDAVLLFSFVGYMGQEILVGEQREINVTLAENTQEIEEVVVVGYGTQKKVNLTGAIASVDAKVLEDRPINSLSGGLQGTIPGLNITSPSGKPGESATLNVRGFTSINGGNPLVLVDGVEMDINLINPNDIASVTVLKDAASSAIYGVRAAYGVVLITTKGAGSSEKTTISYSGNFAFSKPTIMPDMVETSFEHADFVNYAMANAGLNPMYSQDQVNKMRAYHYDPYSNPEYDVIGGVMTYYGYNDWTKMMLRKLTPSQRHNLSISGGSEKTKFYSSVGYLKQEGYYKINPDDYQRLNTRLVVETKATQWLKLTAKALYNHTSTDEPHNYKDNTWHQMVFSSPARPYRWDGDARYPEYDVYKGLYFDDQNPISLLELGGRNHLKQHDIWLTGAADLQFMKNWKGHLDYTYNMNYEDQSYHRKRVDMITARFVPTQGNTSNNSLKNTNNNKSYYSFNAYTEYENTFAGKHYLKGMVGYNQELTKYKTNSATRVNLLSQETPSLNLGTGTQTVEDNGYEWALRGAFFRLNYIFDNRYLLEVNGRYDGTSRFPKDDRFVFLPSFSAAWRVSEEGFMDWSKTILNNLKIRGSYGSLGNQLLNSDSWSGNNKYYPYIPFMANKTSTGSFYPNVSPNGISTAYLFGLAQDVVMNPYGLVSSNLTWEKAATLNFGVDVTILSSRLDLSFDWFQRTTSEMLLRAVYPELLGTASPPINGAELRTRGWEIGVTWRDKIGEDFSYDVGVILSDAQAEITKYDNPTGTLSDHYVGKKMGEIWGYTTEGIFQSPEEIAQHPDQSKLGKNWAEGDIKYQNLNDDNVINNGSNTIDDHGDLSVIGNETARYTYGITANASYKGFFLNIFLQGVGKRDFWPSAQPFWPVATQYFNTQKWFVSDSWTPENRDAYFARPVARDTKNREKQTRYLQDASYLRLKNLTVGYSLPQRWIDYVSLSKVQVYLSAENLFEISSIKGAYDPEAAEKNGTMIYPFQRTFSVGLNVTF